MIECKRPDLDLRGEKAVAEAVSQMLRNQEAGEIPHLFVYSQLLLALSVNDALYATTGTAKRFWSIWREEGEVEAAIYHSSRFYRLLDRVMPDWRERRRRLNEVELH